MERKGCYDYVADSRDVDYRGCATPTAMIHYILEAAGQDADLNGFGVRDLNCDNCTWVLSRMAVEFFRWPGSGDAFTVRTWVNEVNRVMTTRNMAVTGADGTPLAAAVTQWAIIDVDRRAAVDIRAHVDYEGKVADEPSPIAKPARIDAFEPRETSLHRVAYSDIDFNRHMNSLKYIGLMADMVPIGHYETKRVSRVDIHFIHEALYGQRLAVGCDQRGGESLFEITDEGGQPLCRAAFRWKDI